MSLDELDFGKGFVNEKKSAYICRVKGEFAEGMTTLIASATESITSPKV